MRRYLSFVLPLVAMCGSTAAVPQTQAERAQYEPLYRFAYDGLKKETETINKLQQQLLKTTELVPGCKLLNESLVHLKAADKLLGEMDTYTSRLKLEKDNKVVLARREANSEEIKLKTGDIERMCQNLPAE